MDTKIREIVKRYVMHMDAHEHNLRVADGHLASAEQAAEDLVEHFRGEHAPEIIVALGRVVEINRALLTTEHAMPHHAVRLVRDVTVLEDNGDA